MLTPRSPIIIFCEGKTEFTYVQNLARLLREYNSSIQLIPKDIGGGTVINIRKKIKEYRKNNKKLEGSLLLRDYDVVLWDRHEEITSIQLGVNILYSYQNFEDFLVLHMPDNIVREWVTSTTQAGHFSKPLHAEDYLNLFRQIVCPNYKKGELPFELTVDLLNKMLANNNDEKLSIHSDFAIWIKENCVGIF